MMENRDWSERADESIKSEGMEAFRPSGMGYKAFAYEYENFMMKMSRQSILDFHECEKLFIYEIKLKWETERIRFKY